MVYAPQVAESLKSFEAFMGDAAITSPPSVAATIANMVDDQIRVHQQHIGLLDNIR